VSQTLNVHVRVNDAETGQPTPVRIRFSGPNGEYFPPLGRSAVFPVGRNEDVGGHVYLNQKRYAYIDGTCEVSLPTAVPLNLEISKGPAYLPIRQTVTLGEGQLAFRFALQRWNFYAWAAMKAADTRCHFVSPHTAHLEAAAEGLDFANLLAVAQDFPSTDGHLYRTTPNITAFSGEQPAIGSVFVNTFNSHPALGRVGLLNCHRAVYPLTFGHMDETDDWSLSDWCDQCHRKKGLVVWCDAYRPEAGLPGGEALVAAILGKVDAIELDAHERKTPFLTYWYRLLNAGISLPIVGGSGKDSNRVAIGSVRTLTPAEKSQSYADWVKCVRAGETVAGNGPTIRLLVDVRCHPSEVEDSPRPIRLDEFPRPVRLVSFVASREPVERIEIVSNGEVIGSAPFKAHGSHSVQVEHTLSDSCWIAARCWGTARPELYPHVPVFAHTSPVFVQVAGRPFPRAPQAVATLRREIEAVQHWIETEGRFTIPRRKEQLLANCAAALGRL
jgi:hypothetical protein